MLLSSKYITSSGIVFATNEPVWYSGFILLRTDANQPAEFTAYRGTTPVGSPFYRYILGKDDPRTARVVRDHDEEIALVDGVYVTLAANSILIVFYRSIGP